jgi:hypothetical protein
MIVGHPLGASETVSWTKDVVDISPIIFHNETGMNVVHHTWFGCWWQHQVDPKHLQ